MNKSTADFRVPFTRAPSGYQAIAEIYKRAHRYKAHQDRVLQANRMRG